jgi:hypothetical protein
MKRLSTLTKLFMLLALVAVSITTVAQTDVTATYLTNADFETNPTGGALDNYIYDVTGWQENKPVGAIDFLKLGTVAYESVTPPFGTAPANGSSVTENNTTLLAIKMHWYPNDLLVVDQTVTLPAGKYILKWDSYVAQTVANGASRMGYVINGVGTYDAFPAAINTWKNHSLTITLLEEKEVTIRMGYTKTASTGGTTSPILFMDNVKLLLEDVSKTELGALITTANSMLADPQPVGASTAYADLQTAVDAAQVVYDDEAASAAQVLGQENALTAAIAAVNSAIIVEERATTWTTLPYNITSLIQNPSFETGNTTGWTNVGGFVGQSNTSFAKKEGTYYVERWQSSGNWQGLKLSQVIKNIPNGIYSLTAAALNNPNTTGGAYVFANDQRAEVFSPDDYTVVVTVTNNQVEIGYEVVFGGNYVATDNFRLSYISDGSPYVVASPGNLFFDPLNLTRTFNVSGGNLTEDATITAPAGISLDLTTLTPEQVATGTIVTATFDNLTSIMSGEIEITTGSVTEKISVMTSADLTCFVPAYTTEAVNMVPNPYLNNISGFGGWGRRAVVYGEEAYCGAAALKFSATTNGWPDGAALDITGIQWQPNSTYRLRAMVKAVDGTVAFFANQTDPNVTIMVPQTGDNWIQIDTLFRTGANPGTSFFSLNNVDGGSTALTVYLDNYELYLAPLGTAINPIATDAPFAYNNDGRIAVRFNIEQAAAVEFAVYNMQGMLLNSSKGTFNAGSNNALLMAADAGVYIVKMRVNGSEYTSKIVL